MPRKKIFHLVILIVLAVYKGFGQQPKLVIPLGHTAEVLSANFSPDGKKVITVSADGTAKLWEASSGKLLTDYKAGGDASAAYVTGATFSNDGKYINISYEYGGLSIWEVACGKEIWDWAGSPSDVKVSLKNVVNHFSPDGGKVLFFHPLFDDSTININHPTIYDNKTRRTIFSLKGQKGEVISSCYSPDGKTIITASADRTIKTWDAGNGRMLRSFLFKTAGLELVRFFPDNRSVFVLADSLPVILDITTGKRTVLLIPNGTTKEELIYKSTPDGKYIAGLSGLEGIVDRLPINYYKEVTVWDVRRGITVFHKTGLAEHEYSALFSPDSKKIMLITNDRTVKVLDAATGQKAFELGKFKNLVHSAAFSKNGEVILTTISDSLLTIWDAASGKLNPALGSDTSKIDGKISEDGRSIKDLITGKIVVELSNLQGLYKPILSSDGQEITAVFRNRLPVTWNASTGQLINDSIAPNEKINEAGISMDANTVLIASYDHTAKLWDLANREFISEFKGRTKTVSDARFSSEQKRILISTESGMKMLDLENGKLITNKAEVDKAAAKDSILSGEKLSADKHHIISPDGKITLNWGADIVQLYAANDNKEDEMLLHANEGLGPLNGRMDCGVKSVVFSPDSRKLIMTLDDYTTRIFNIEKGAFITTIILIDSSDYINKLSNGYYQSTPKAAKMLYYVTDAAKIISFEQLDVKYNRPDKVLEALGNMDTTLITSYRNAYLKRVKKLGIDTTAFNEGYSVPQSDLNIIGNNIYEPASEKIQIHLTGFDSTYPLDRFNVWVNEVPVFGMKGMNINNRKSNQLDTSFRILLSSGQNKIEASVTNNNGTESYRKPVLINYVPVKQSQPKVYFIGIGNDHFADSLYDLKWCVEDIRDLVTTMRSKYGDNLVIVDTLFDGRATRTDIRNLKKKLLSTGVNDKVILAFSGHGLLSKNYDYYLSSYSVNFKEPEQGGIPYDEIEDMMDGIPARKKILLLDACHSGELDKEEMKKITTASSELTNNNISAHSTGRGVIITNSDSKKVGLQNSFDLMQSLFVNVGKGTGATIIAASGGVQFAQERSELGHGVFTYSVIEAMKKYPTISVSEFKKYIGNQVLQLTNGLQKPTTRNETIDVDWNVW